MRAPSLTIGVEEEYQIIDPETRELRSYITEILGDESVELGVVKPELHQSIVEVGTPVCRTPADARAEIVKLRGTVMELADRKGLRIAAAGTHPFSCWTEQEITPLERYVGVKEDMGDLAQQLLIFGTHVHIGIEDREFLVHCMNVCRYFMPHVLCLFASSPFWRGRDTELKSYRSVIFRNFPRTGLPRVFSGWSEYSELVDDLVRTGSVPDGSKIWWDARPHHQFPTLEFRFLDTCTRVEEATCAAAILQALVLKTWKLRQDNLTFRVYPTDLIAENKWRAVRYGLDGNLIDLGRESEAPARELLEELLGWFIADEVVELGTEDELRCAWEILEGGSSADRQVATWRDLGSFEAVVDRLMDETEEGVRG